MWQPSSTRCSEHDPNWDLSNISLIGHGSVADAGLDSDDIDKLEYFGLVAGDRLTLAGLALLNKRWGDAMMYRGPHGITYQRGAMAVGHYASGDRLVRNVHGVAEFVRLVAEDCL